MKPIRWTSHAQKKITSREVNRREVEEAIAHPDSVTAGRPPRHIYMRRYSDAVLRTEMLLRVVVEETAKEFVVVTLYKTSKFKKSERGSRP